VRAAAGLAHPQGGDLLPQDRRLEELLLLLVGADLVDDRRGDLALYEQRHVDAGVSAVAQLLAERGDVPVIEAAAAPLRIMVDAEEAQLSGLLEDLAGEDSGAVPLQRVRRQLLLREVAHRTAKGFVLFGERVQHRRSSLRFFRRGS